MAAISDESMRSSGSIGMGVQGSCRHTPSVERYAPTYLAARAVLRAPPGPAGTPGGPDIPNGTGAHRRAPSPIDPTHARGVIEAQLQLGELQQQLLELADRPYREWADIAAAWPTEELGPLNAFRAEVVDLWIQR